jgi:hypothetical protein
VNFGGNFFVHYSLSFNDDGRTPRLARQLDISLTTLRVHNPTVDVIAFCHGAVPDDLRAIAHRHRVDVIEQPDPTDRLTDEIGRIGATIGRFGPVHKFLNLAELARRTPDATLYLDADTVVFGDLGHLAGGARGPAVIAREEVGSRRCRFGADRPYLDEDALAATVADCGLAAPSPAFNTGAILLHDFPWASAERIERRYLAWLTRFAVWMADHPSAGGPRYADVFDLAELRGGLDGPHGLRIKRVGAPYPSVNRWLVEEMAAWVALGQEPDLEFAAFDPRDVAQGGEPLEGPLPRAIWHYFSSNEAGMERRLGLARSAQP